MVKNKIFVMVLLLLLPIILLGNNAVYTYSLKSPDDKINFSINISDLIYISADYSGKRILEPSDISMTLSDCKLGIKEKGSKIEKKKISEILHPVIKVKSAEINNNCNELTIFFKNKFFIVLRAYNEGFAYRFGTNLGGRITILSDTGNYNFPENHMVWAGEKKKFRNDNQFYFKYTSLRELNDKYLIGLPLIIYPAKGPKIVFTETDLIDYTENL